MNTSDKNLNGRKVTARATQQITTRTDSREILANAKKDIARYHLNDYLIVDVDAHHTETRSWSEVIERIEDPVLKYNAKALMETRPLAKHLAFSNAIPGLAMQDVYGRIPHNAALAEDVEENGEHKDLTLIRRGIDSMGIDVQVIFPTPMLTLGEHPVPEIATALTFAYNRWFTSTILPREDRIKTLLMLPFDDPSACVKMVKEFGEVRGVVGFMVTSQRRNFVHDNSYMPLYRELEERGLPLAFHAGFTWGDSLPSRLNRFLSVHALTFVTCNMIHVANWITNGMVERFPKLKTIWVESGLAWIPFLMQRLDSEYFMRQSEAPLLRKPPSEYMSEMFYTSQPMEVTNMELLQSTFKAMKAETQLMYASDWPHWDFDLPGRIAGLPFLEENAKRSILGETAIKLFRLDREAILRSKKKRQEMNHTAESSVESLS